MLLKNEQKNNFIKQAGILAAAGIISRIIGLLYRSPLHGVIGSLGLGYYQSAYNYYTIILLISSYSIPAAISKVIAQKLAVKEYRNAHRIFKCALWYVLVVGGIASLFLYFCAGIFVAPEAIPVLRTFAPTIFVYGILGVLRGYFQAHGSMVQTSVSQILEQIANAVVSISAAYLLIYSVMGTMEMPAEEGARVMRATNGAIGSALGTGAGVLIALLFMLAVYLLNKGLMDRRILADEHEKEDSYGKILKAITSIVTPFILSTAVYNLSGAVNNTIYTKIFPMFRETAGVDIYSGWGVFAGQALTISNIPIAFASAMASAMIPSVAAHMAEKNVEKAKEKIGLAIKTTMLISIPCAVGVFALARPITAFLFPRNLAAEETMATYLLMALALSVVFYALSTLSSSILQGLGKVNAPIFNAGFALIGQTLLALGLLLFTNLDLYSIAIANTVYAGIMCWLNQRSVRKAVGYRQEIKQTFVIPGIAAICMGLIARVAYQALLLWSGSLVLALILSVLLGALVYFAIMLLTGGLKAEALFRKYRKK